MIIYDKEKIVEWLTEISLRPCDFSRPEDYDENMTEDLADGALELLKEQEAVEPIITPWAEDEDGNIVVAKKECGKCGYQFFTERPKFCENCGTPILWECRRSGNE